MKLGMKPGMKSSKCVPSAILASLLLLPGQMLTAQAVAAQAVPNQPVATPGKAPALAQSALDKSALESYLRYSELWIPQVSVKIDDPKPSSAINNFFDVGVHLTYNGATKDELYYVSKDGRNIVKGTAYDITQSPFQGNIDLLKGEHQPSFGAPAGAPLNLVVFGDFECPVCQKEEQDLRKNIPAAFGEKVHVMFYDFPLTSIHPWAMKGSLAGRCVYRNGEKAFWDYHDWIYSKQQTVTLENFGAKIDEFAKEKGLDSGKIDACLADKSIAAEVEKTVGLGHQLEISATPTLFINGRKIEGALDWNVLSQLLQIELDHRAAEGKVNPSSVAAKSEKSPSDKAKEDDKCCIVEIPSAKPAASK
jgi:protein-disulfide isomerase